MHSIYNRRGQENVRIIGNWLVPVLYSGSPLIHGLHDFSHSGWRFALIHVALSLVGLFSNFEDNGLSLIPVALSPVALSLEN
jgi:hypothetical protein